MDQTAKKSTVDRLQQATNILVTVSNNPSVDQLAACIGLTLFLNKLGKHATAVFSGKVPSTLEFLQPDKTIEANTDSLRDFIISLDKSKADKLRYKVEDKVVKIFITPYKSSITAKDFEFSQGDFNVDAVIALGVHVKEELDQAIVAHGRILHDATIISINNAQASNLGTLNWQDQQASSLCEMLVELGEILQPDSFDGQMATAFLTGIVAETKRFSNEKTSARTMSLSAKLMAAGANQQLVASQLQSRSTTKRSSGIQPDNNDDGTLLIDHEANEQTPAAAPRPVSAPKPKHTEVSLPKPAPSSPIVAPEPPRIPIGDVRNEDNGNGVSDLMTSMPNGGQPRGSSFPIGPPSRGGTLTANTQPEELSPSVDPLSNTEMGSSLTRGNLRPYDPSQNDLGDKTLTTIEDAVVDQDKTLTDIEQTLDSPHVGVSSPAPKVEDLSAAARNLAYEMPNQPIASLGSTPLDMNLHGSSSPAAPASSSTASTSYAPPQSLVPPDPGLPAEQTGVNLPPAPPPMPPPMMPPPSS